MTEVKNRGNPEEQFLKLRSASTRKMDLAKSLGHKGLGGESCPYFEVGKYRPNPDAVKTKVKMPMSFDNQVSRATAQASVKEKPAAALDEKGTSQISDRSRYRHGEAARKSRVTHVMEFSKDLKRPPIIQTGKPDYDDNDPVVLRLVHERAMRFNADTVGRAVEPRSDYSLNMSQSIDRDKAAAGTRLLQNDIVQATKTGRTGFETTSSMSASADLKDTIRVGGDTVPFDKQKYREVTKLKAEYSSLQRPRDHAAPDFSRSAPLQGFSTSTPVNHNLPRDRSHEAMPGWTPSAADSLAAED
jgi:hypothetical protein